MLVIFLLLALLLTPYVIKTYNRSTILREAVGATIGDLTSANERRTAIFNAAADQIAKGDSYEVAFQKAVLTMRGGLPFGKPDTSSAPPMFAVAESYPAPASIQLRRDFGGTVQEVEFSIQTKVERCNAAIEAYNTFVTAIPAIIVLFPIGRRRIDFIASTDANGVLKSLS